MAQRLYRKAGNPVWYGVYYDRHGIRRKRCTWKTSKRAAERVLAGWEDGEARADRDAPAKAPHSVAEAIDHLINASDTRSSHYEYKGGHVVRLLGNLDANLLRPDDLQGYVDLRLKEGAARESIRKELAALGRALRMAKKRGLFSGDLEELLPEFEATYVPRQRWLSLQEFGRLMEQLRTDRQLWVTVAVFTGGRRGEVEGLRWEHIDWTAGTVELRGTKTTGSHRTIPLPDGLARVLEPLRWDEAGEARSGPVVRPWGKVWRDLEVACRAAGIARVTANDFRRTYASWLIQKGVSNAVVAKLLGHTSTAMVDRVYGKHSVDSLARAVKALPAPKALKKPKKG